MAKFKPLMLVAILAIEGNYANDPDDTGGETWQGVARNINPKWSGWAIVDAIKAANPMATKNALRGNPTALNFLLKQSKELSDKVATLYEAGYWDINRLDEINDQALAMNACDCGVNCGTYTGAKFLQRAYNMVRVDALPLVEDGKIGTKSIAAINTQEPEFIYTAYNALRKAYYDDIITRRPSQAKFKKSWYSRIKPYKNIV